MRSIRKYLIIICLLFTPFLAQAGLKSGFANTESSTLANFAASSGYLESTTPEYYIGLALQILFSLIGVILIGLIVYSGATWMLARGNKEKVTKAKDTLLEAILGLLFIIGGYALSIFLLKVLIK